MNTKSFHKLSQVVMVMALLVTLAGCAAPIQDTRSQTNIALSAELNKNFSENNFEADLALADDNIEITAYAFGLTLQGKEQFGGFMQGFKTAFPDLAIKQTNVVASGDQVVIEFEATGTQTGPLVTPAGEIPASGKSVKLNVLEVHTWKNGKLTKIVNYQDSGSLLRQIGEGSTAINIIQRYYAALNAAVEDAKAIDQAMSLLAADALFINPTGSYETLEEIRASLEGGAADGLTFELSNFRDTNGRVVYDYKVKQGDALLDSGTDGLTIVKDGKIVFDGTERTDPGQ